MGQIINWSAVQGSGSAVTTYATFGDFPATATDGTVALALDTDNLYAYNANTMMWLLIGSPTNAVQTIQVFTLSGTDITNKYVTLSSAPLAPSLTIMNVVTGPVQEYGVDFNIIGPQLGWNGLGLDGILTAGDKLIIQFE